MFPLRSKPYTTTKVSPFQLMYSPEARFPSQVAEDQPEFILSTETEYAGIINEKKTKDQCSRSRQNRILSLHRKSKKKNSKTVTKKYKPCAFIEGQLVPLKNCRRSTRKGGMLEHKFTGPYTVAKIQGKHVKLLNASNLPLHTMHNLDILRPFNLIDSSKPLKGSMTNRESASSLSLETLSEEIEDFAENQTCVSLWGTM
ncbi:uncharacterized protein LOC144783068 [Lissotriton helveticus]